MQFGHSIIGMVFGSFIPKSSPLDLFFLPPPSLFEHLNAWGDTTSNKQRSWSNKGAYIK